MLRIRRAFGDRRRRAEASQRLHQASPLVTLQQKEEVSLVCPTGLMPTKKRLPVSGSRKVALFLSLVPSIKGDCQRHLEV